MLLCLITSYLLTVLAKSTRKSKKVRRLRSRNTIVDDWLADEDGDDIYADLENFLVP